ncbi:MAG: FHA domain-containing protein [Planctomycetota bacterium]|nr:FHA domain-containing protein [Planctomycetota bacterium]
MSWPGQIPASDPAIGSQFPVLRSLGGESEGYVLARPVNLLGSGNHCDIVAGEAGVAREHAMLARRHDRTYIVNLGEIKTLLVNGRPVRYAALSDRDVIQVGDARFVYLAAAPMPRGEAPIAAERPVAAAVEMPAGPVVPVAASDRGHGLPGVATPVAPPIPVPPAASALPSRPAPAPPAPGHGVAPGPAPAAPSVPPSSSGGPGGLAGGRSEVSNVADTTILKSRHTTPTPPSPEGSGSPVSAAAILGRAESAAPPRLENLLTPAPSLVPQAAPPVQSPPSSPPPEPSPSETKTTQDETGSKEESPPLTWEEILRRAVAAKSAGERAEDGGPVPASAIRVNVGPFTSMDVPHAEGGAGEAAGKESEAGTRPTLMTPPTEKPKSATTVLDLLKSLGIGSAAGGREGSQPGYQTPASPEVPSSASADRGSPAIPSPAGVEAAGTGAPPAGLEAGTGDMAGIVPAIAPVERPAGTGAGQISGPPAPAVASGAATETPPETGWKDVATIGETASPPVAAEHRLPFRQRFEEYPGEAEDVSEKPATEEITPTAAPPGTGREVQPVGAADVAMPEGGARATVSWEQPAAAEEGVGAETGATALSGAGGHAAADTGGCAGAGTAGETAAFPEGEAQVGAPVEDTTVGAEERPGLSPHDGTGGAWEAGGALATVLPDEPRASALTALPPDMAAASPDAARAEAPAEAAATALPPAAGTTPEPLPPRISGRRPASGIYKEEGPKVFGVKRRASGRLKAAAPASSEMEPAQRLDIGSPPPAPSAPTPGASAPSPAPTPTLPPEFAKELWTGGIERQETGIGWIFWILLFLILGGGAVCMILYGTHLLDWLGF